MVFNGAEFHLLANHVPVIGFVGAVIALIVAAKLKSLDIKRFVLGITVLAGLSSLASYFTGEPAEDVIEHLSGVDKALIEEHEEAAEYATILAVSTGVAAALALFLQRNKPDSLNKTIPGVLVLSLVTCAAMAKTAHDGGKIRHPEIRSGSIQAQ